MNNKSDPTFASSSFDEEAFERDLLFAEAHARAIHTREERFGRWAWINKPITIWILTTVAVGLLSFCYTNYSSCRTSLQTDNDRLDRLEAELTYRAGVLVGVVSSYASSTKEGTEDDTAEERIAERSTTLAVSMDPSVSYHFEEFRGKFPDEIAYEAGRIVSRWYAAEARAADDERRTAMYPLFDMLPNLTTDKRSTSLLSEYIGEIMTIGRQPLPGEEPYLHWIAFGGFLDKFDVWRGLFMGLASPADAIVASQTIKRAERLSGALVADIQYFSYPGRSSALSPSVCFRRSLGTS
ncbi:MAG: hypothetical protein ACM30I_07980 [Gemmatimonas sp.]